MSPPVRVNRTLSIPLSEIELTFSTSGGPGGQHANRSATRVDLAWNVAASKALGPRQRQRIQRKLAPRIDSSGTLRLSSNRYRSQMRNREDVLQRLARLVGDALKTERKRLPTSPTEQSRERRLQQKRRRAELKRLRRGVGEE